MKKQSKIRGQGYGDSHTWIRGETNQAEMGESLDWDSKYTLYSCECGDRFRHMYDIIPDIFQAIEQSRVSDKCPLSSS